MLVGLVNTLFAPDSRRTVDGTDHRRTAFATAASEDAVKPAAKEETVAFALLLKAVCATVVPPEAEAGVVEEEEPFAVDTGTVSTDLRPSKVTVNAVLRRNKAGFALTVVL